MMRAVWAAVATSNVYRIAHATTAVGTILHMAALAVALYWLVDE